MTMPTPAEIRSMAERLDTKPRRPTRSVTLDNRISVTSLTLSTFSQDDTDRKDAAVMLRELLAEREHHFDKIDGLSSDLDSAVSVIRRHSAQMQEWVQLNYPLPTPEGGE